MNELDKKIIDYIYEHDEHPSELIVYCDVYAEAFVSGLLEFNRVNFGDSSYQRCVYSKVCVEVYTTKTIKQKQKFIKQIKTTQQYNVVTFLDVIKSSFGVKKMNSNEQLKQFLYGFLACGLTVALVFVMWGGV